MVAAVPSEVNALTILRAKNTQLKHWIQEVNDAAGPRKTVLTKSGKKAELQAKLAAHYNIDLSAPNVASLPIGPLTIDSDIHRRQWAHLRELGREWRDNARAGRPFVLCRSSVAAYDPVNATTLEPGLNDRDVRDVLAHGSLPHLGLLHEIRQVLNSLKDLAVRAEASSLPFAHKHDASDSTPPNAAAGGVEVSNETVYAWMGAALRGDGTALHNLQSLLVQKSNPSTFVPREGTLPSPTHPGHLPPTLPPSSSSSSSESEHDQLPWPNSPMPFGIGGLNGRAAAALEAAPLHRPASAHPAAYQAVPNVTPAMPEGSSTSGCAATAAQAPLPPSPGSSMWKEAKLLDVCEEDVLSLKQAVNLRFAIEQVEDGSVQEMRDCYGPSEHGRRKASPNWDSVKVTITRRERLYKVFKDDFGGDREQFFGFFSVEKPKRKPKRKKKGDSSSGTSNSDHNLRPLRRVVEAIPWMQKDIEEGEMLKREYVNPDTGTFSHTLWTEKWGAANMWEVWRAIGKERYRKLEG